MEMNPFSADFFPSLMEKYRNEIIEPYKNCRELFDTLKSLYCFEPIGYEEAMIEMRGFITDQNIAKGKSMAYLLKPDNSSEIFYRNQAARFSAKSRIILFLDKENERFISNNQLFQLRVNILRGINGKEVDNFTQECKEYLNLLYLYDWAIEMDNSSC